MQTSELIKQLDAALEMRKRRDYAGALGQFEYLERQSEHPQDIAGLRLFQVTCLTDMGRLEDALKQLSRVDKDSLIFSGQIDYEYERARIERALGHPREALDLVVKTLRIIGMTNGENDVRGIASGLHTLHGLLLAESGRCDEAMPMLESVPAEDEGWAEARIHLGDCKIRKRLYREAIECYESVASNSNKTDPIHRTTAIRNIGCAFYYMGEYAKAVEYLTRVEHGYDGAPDLKAELFGILASAYSRLGMTGEAAKYSGFSRTTNSLQ